MIEVLGSGNSFAAFRDGKQITRRYWNKETALRAAERIEKQRQVRNRKCLNCAQVFRSEGPHNRLCTTCRRL
ncbi:MAG: hypothetical protein Tsb0024_10030 [Ruegeria sp.]